MEKIEFVQHFFENDDKLAKEIPIIEQCEDTRLNKIKVYFNNIKYKIRGFIFNYKRKKLITRIYKTCIDNNITFRYSCDFPNIIIKSRIKEDFLLVYKITEPFRTSKYSTDYDGTGFYIKYNIYVKLESNKYVRKIFK